MNVIRFVYHKPEENHMSQPTEVWINDVRIERPTFFRVQKTGEQLAYIDISFYAAIDQFPKEIQ